MQHTCRLDMKLLFFSTLMAHSSPVCLCTAWYTVPKAPLPKASASTSYRSCNRSTEGIFGTSLLNFCNTERIRNHKPVPTFQCKPMESCAVAAFTHHNKK